MMRGRPRNALIISEPKPDHRTLDGLAQLRAALNSLACNVVPTNEINEAISNLKHKNLDLVVATFSVGRESLSVFDFLAPLQAHEITPKVVVVEVPIVECNDIQILATSLSGAEYLNLSKLTASELSKALDELLMTIKDA